MDTEFITVTEIKEHPILTGIVYVGFSNDSATHLRTANDYNNILRAMLLSEWDICDIWVKWTTEKTPMHGLKELVEDNTPLINFSILKGVYPHVSKLR